jgi:peptidoglycan L-alanyl-D-glutamate endopeptidase CwlK
MFSLSAASRARLAGVHPDLVRVVERAIRLTKVDFMVLCGCRSVDEQRECVARGVSRTMNSRHIPSGDPPVSHAVDLVALPGGKVSWDWMHYPLIAAAMKEAAFELRVPLTWGGEWKSLRDGPHFELPASAYPGSSSARTP